MANIPMTHPKTGGVTEVPEGGTARTVLEARGWEASTAADPTPMVETLNREQLDELALERGLDPTAYRTKADLAAALAPDTD